MPPNLPDARTAQRLLDILAQLEQSLRHGRQTTGAVSGEMQTRLANLQFENQRLRNTRKQASLRLETLIAQLTQQAGENPEAETPAQEDAA